MTRLDVSFPSDGLQLAGHLYLPPTPPRRGDGRRPGVVLDGPMPSVKEMTVPVYGIRLARAGYVVFTFDRRGFGASEGTVRQHFNPPDLVRDSGPGARPVGPSAGPGWEAVSERVESATRIGRYRLEGVVGTGAFATVYRAVDERMEDTVAVKVLAENHSLDPDVRERFLAEGRVLRRVDSPHVIGVYDLGETDRQQPYLVLEYADRGTLAARVAGLRRGGWHPTGADVRALAGSLAASVEAVHAAEVVHRDLSPGNVLVASTPGRHARPITATGRGDSDTALLASDERLLLADLGLCKDLALNSGHTAAGGTEGFRPPEQRDGPTIVTAVADIWSPSALVAWLVTGAPPPDDASVRDQISAAGLPDELGAVLDRSLARDPAVRHPDPATWLDAVDGVLRSAAPAPVVAAAAGDARPRVGQREAPGGRGLRRSRAIAIALVAALGLGLGMVVLQDHLADGGADVTRLDNGDVQVARTVAGATIAIEGPEEVGVDETALFTARVDDDIDEWVWATPERSFELGAQLEVRASSPGVATVTLLARAPSGEVISVSHDVRVDDATGDD
ncbi:MAG: protein kinase domain-containing protein [Acidimicrobiales bacterium]